MRKLFILLLIPVSLLAQEPRDFKIKGDLNLAHPAGKAYLQYTSGDNGVTDSVEIKNNSFAFKGVIYEPTIATLSIKHENVTDRAKAFESIRLFLEPGKMELTAKDSLLHAVITGSVAQKELEKLQEMEKPYAQKEQDLIQEYIKARTAGDQETMKKMEQQIDAIDNQVRENVYGAYVKANPKSPAALYALRQAAGYEIDPAKTGPLFNLLPASTQRLPSAVAMQKEIEIAKKTAVGTVAMDFTQNDTAGHAVSLSSFKGKYVLVDFWASWCGPCRQENPNVVRAFHQYSNKNFTILSVSLDRPAAREKWLKAIHDDGLVWNHVSDLKYWDNAVAKQYGIRAIPQNLLIDPNGKIIAKNLRGDALNEKLAQLFGNGTAGN